MDPLKRKLADAGWADLDDVIDLTEQNSSSSSARAGPDRNALKVAGWGDLEEVIDLTEGSCTEEAETANPKRKLKRSRRQVALRSKGKAHGEKSFTGSISVESFSEALLRWRVERELEDKSASTSVLEETAKVSTPMLHKVPSTFKVSDMVRSFVA